MPKINQKEYDILKQLDDKWKWIARDSDSPGKWFANSLEVYTDKPEKTEDTVWTNGNGSEKLNKDFFQFIQWSDEEPYNIQELIEEYEEEEYGYFNMKLSREYEQFIEESEETEVKNIEWLKKEVNELPLRFLGFSVLKQREEFAVIKDDVLDLIGQLDEPEVLSQELPVIPQFVAEYLDFAKSDVPLMRVLELANTRNELPKWKKEYDWISANDETFARAWLDGYTVEEEQKYYIKITKYDFMVMDDDGYVCPENLSPHDYKSTFTEQEIKDYDERYWPFAVKVEEMEE